MLGEMHLHIWSIDTVYLFCNETFVSAPSNISIITFIPDPPFCFSPFFIEGSAVFLRTSNLALYASPN